MIDLKKWIAKVSAWMSVKEYHNIGTFVNVKSYTSSNKYTVPCDGYLHVYNGGASAYAIIVGPDGQNAMGCCGVQNGRTTTFVRKGMQIYTYGSPSDVRFYPLGGGTV